MGKIGVVEVRRQEGRPPPKRPPDGTPVWMAIDLSRSQAVYCLRWDGSEQRRLSTPLGIEHVRALLAHYHGCQVHVAYEACGFGYELAWWLQEHGVVARNANEGPHAVISAHADTWWRGVGRDGPVIRAPRSEPDRDTESAVWMWGCLRRA